MVKLLIILLMGTALAKGVDTANSPPPMLIQDTTTPLDAAE
jgi:hypothetical protein